MQIENSVALVTGANRGVGRHHVAQLIEHCAARVYAASRNVDTLSETIELDPQRVVSLALDVTNTSMIEAVASTVNDVTLLINNAGSLTFGGALDVTDAGLAQDMAVNYDGLRGMTRTFAPIIESNGGGAIVNMLTLMSFISAPGFAGYNASKAAAWSMAMSLRAYLRPKDIQVINAFPAGIDTDMLAGIDAPKDNPEAVVRDILAAVVVDQEDIYPASASDVFDAWRADQKSIEAAFAEMM
ncbi:SDR family NAD(P)-dependent oxidoreductase [Ruegeria sp. R13_0]|uniref:SDR family NAD(P)-dependent oxidoreductase n=1 Tax=Ruegeria sp. R13_0 TaxID=2821099 RepID=UPI001ADA6167|nr:SDR family NAD(P)-dependent oxidoreductase [Ruegeria sp. R13_0]MBO9436914.1 SDR family NAD(P)-dependent oxidoreductase [Ruegeria sp. R13_0]